HHFDTIPRLLSAALLLGGDAVGIGEYHSSRADRRAADLHGHVDLAGTVFRALARVAGQSLDAELHLGQSLTVTDGTVDDDTVPAVSNSCLGDHVTHEGGGDRSVTVDDEHGAVAGLVEGLLDQSVVLEAADGASRSGE